MVEDQVKPGGTTEVSAGGAPRRETRQGLRCLRWAPLLLLQGVVPALLFNLRPVSVTDESNADPVQPANITGVLSSPDTGIEGATGKINQTADPSSSNCRFLDLLVLSDRNNSEVPLRALVNSLLSYTSSPIHLNIATRISEDDSSIQWLTDLRSRHFHVSLHHTENLLQSAIHLVNSTSLKLGHPSSKYAMQKLFLPELDLHLSSPMNQQILMMDDDQIFIEDITPLYEQIHEVPDAVSLLCKRDRFNVRKICTNAGLPHNCDTYLYCVTGLVGFPISNSTSREWLVHALKQSARDMAREYPNSICTQADQDVFNRFFREYHRTPRVQIIPCQWSCGSDECACKGKTCRDGVFGKHGCRGCPLLENERCKALHYQGKTYLTNHSHLAQHMSWDYYFTMKSQAALKDFDSRILRRDCKSSERWVGGGGVSAPLSH